jgi:integrase
MAFSKPTSIILWSSRVCLQPEPQPAVVILSNTGLRNAELRHARWRQVDFLKSEFQVGKSKTAGGEGRIVPLNQAALVAFTDWRSRSQDARSEDYIFASEKLVFKSVGSPEQGVMTPYAVDRSKPTGSWKRAWNTAKKLSAVECRMHDLRHSFVSKLA